MLRCSRSRRRRRRRRRRRVRSGCLSIPYRTSGNSLANTRDRA
jgi:hypothetical protein